MVTPYRVSPAPVVLLGWVWGMQPHPSMQGTDHFCLTDPGTGPRIPGLHGPPRL